LILLLEADGPSKGAFPEDDGDESDGMVFGDDDDLDAFE